MLLRLIVDLFLHNTGLKIRVAVIVEMWLMVLMCLVPLGGLDSLILD